MKRFGVSLLSLIGVFSVRVATAEGQFITEFTIPTANSAPQGITADPDGNLWFTESSGNKIGRISPTSPNTIAEFLIPSANSSPRGITADPDGNIWFTEYVADNIGRISTSPNAITELSLRVAGNEPREPQGITTGPDGNVWFLEDPGLLGFGGARIDRITPTNPSSVVGWFYLGEIRTSGLTTGRDGNLWFTESSHNNIGRITTSGTVTEFPIPTANSFPQGITAGPDGNLWFTELLADKIGRIAPTSPNTITEFPIPTANSYPQGITAGPDGNLWFTESLANSVARLNLALVPTLTPTPTPTFTSTPTATASPSPTRSFSLPGDLDRSFGGAGTVTTQISGPLGGGSANAVAIQPDGKIVVAGYAYVQHGTSPVTSTGPGFTVARYNTDGLLDASFGTGGTVTTTISSNVYSFDIANAVGIQGNGNIVAAGTSTYTDINARLNFYSVSVARFSNGGSLDRLFTGSGVPALDLAWAVAVQTDGKIVVAGQTSEDILLRRYDTDGSLDTTFGSGGNVYTSIGDVAGARALVIEPNGKIVVAGSVYVESANRDDWALARYNTDGSLDSSFGSGGKVTTTLAPTRYNGANALVLQPDGKLVAAGYVQSTNYALVRYNSDGSLDTTFGSGGKVATTISGTYANSGAFALVLQSDGKLIATGALQGKSSRDFGVLRFDPDGSLDSTFGSGGMVSTDFSGADDVANAAAREQDGKLVVAGFSTGQSGGFAVARYLLEEPPTPTPTLTPTTTPTATPTMTPTNTPTATETSTFTPTCTPTATPSATNSPIPTPTNTPTQIHTAPPTATPTRTLTNTPTSTQRPTFTPTPTVTATPSATVSATPTATPFPCGGDCNGSGEVTVNELIAMVNIGLGIVPVSACDAGDVNRDGSVTIDEILGAVNHALRGCPVSTNARASSPAGAAGRSSGWRV